MALVIRNADKIPENGSALKLMGFYAAIGSGMGGAGSSPYPRRTEDLAHKTKQEWLARSFDYSEWVDEQKRLRQSKNVQQSVTLPKSVIAAGLATDRHLKGPS